MRQFGCMLLAVALLSSGCLPAMWLRDEQKPPQVQMKEPPPPSVTADGITEANAAQKAQVLRQEMEYDLRQTQRSAPATEDDQ